MTPDQDRILREVHSMLGALHYAVIPSDDVSGQGETIVRLRTIDSNTRAGGAADAGAHTHEVGPAIPTQ